MFNRCTFPSFTLFDLTSCVQDYIDLSLPLEAKFSLSDSDESGIADEGSSSRDSANVTGEDTDSVFEHNARAAVLDGDGR